MGQAWCKERTTKAQDSKSPLDRVFVRCAHRIYPSLKEEGSVLGGATQRVTSSEIGYAGSPPREVLTRGRSIDSVDRPFHPSDWVDVNLEVPSTPRPSSALTNLTVDTSLYPATTPTSSCSNLKDSTPVPPPRRRKRNKGRPLPPKPDEIGENPPSNLKTTETGDEPLYSSVKSPKANEDEEDGGVEEDEEEQNEAEEGSLDKQSSREDARRDGRKTKEIYEHKVNGTGRIISSDVVSGKRASHVEDRKSNHHLRRVQDGEEYEKFARSRTSKDSSTPNREDKRGSRDPEIKDTPREKSTGNARPKNYSTVSLPNYDELDVARHQAKGTRDSEGGGDKTKPRRPVRSSTGSLPAESFLSPFSEKTSVRLEDYIPRRSCPDNLSPYQVLEKLGENGVVGTGFVKYDPSKSEDWDLDGISNCELNHQRRVSFEEDSRTSVKLPAYEGEDIVDFPSRDETRRSDSDSPIHLQKPEAFGKTPSPVPGEPEYAKVDPNRSHLRYDPPTLADSCRVSAACELPVSKEPFFLDETKQRSALDTIVGNRGKDEPNRSDQSRMIFSPSNESEPDEDTYEPKELTNHVAGLVRTISQESLPQEMVEVQKMDQFFDEKLAKDTHNKLKKSLDDSKARTPPPSPEPRIKPELVDSEHSTLLKVLKEEAEESNLSSMTPSLTELEAALSDMLEKEESQESVKDEGKCGGQGRVEKLELASERNPGSQTDYAKTASSVEAAAAAADQILVESKRKNESPVSLGQILEDRKPITGRKVSFCAWEETLAEDDREFTERPGDLDKNTVSHPEGKASGSEELRSYADLPPEKPSRLNRSLEDLVEDAELVPTPPRRRNKSLGVAKKEVEDARNGSVLDIFLNDRLI
ncbi:uncharacterized protein LOC143187333 isoform X2 [Calliopsis andreniformis]|uniref:uncharacterized protein LOC143187333 isoform X2 n=1 Tax=Calliopsis andreniformis TaxID=337506 RepID=UPI003FCDF9FD